MKDGKIRDPNRNLTMDVQEELKDRHHKALRHAVTVNDCNAKGEGKDA
jgi:hypothetical protein